MREWREFRIASQLLKLGMFQDFSHTHEVGMREILTRIPRLFAFLGLSCPITRRLLWGRREEMRYSGAKDLASPGKGHRD